MASLPSSFRGRNGFSSIRYLGVLKQPESPPGRNPSFDYSHRSHDYDGDGDGDGHHQLLELDEGDVFWSPASYSDLSDTYSLAGSAGPNSPLSTASTCRSASSLSPSSNYPHHRGRRDGRGRQFTPERFGLSAALAEEPGPLVQQRKPSLDPSVAARTVPPVAVPRAGQGPEGYPTGPGKVFGQSAPLNVPVWPSRGHRSVERRLNEVGEWGEQRAWDEEDEDGEMVPPHLIVARSQGMSFSVFEGVGRTLKGRDLRRVRNAVFQKTGFLD